MASARAAPSPGQENDSTEPNITAQQEQYGGVDYRYGDAAILSHSFNDDILFIYLLSSDSILTFKIPNYSQDNLCACLDLHKATNPNAQDDLDPHTIMSAYNSLIAAARHGVITTLIELKDDQHVSLRKARDAYWVGVAQIIVKATQYAGFEPYIRADFFEKALKTAIENSSGLNATQTCNYELLHSSLTTDNDLYNRMWTAQVALRDVVLAQRVVVVVAPESIINTEVRTVASEDDTRAALLESFRRAGSLAANAQTTADANDAFRLVDNAMWALRRLEDGDLGEESSDSDDDNNNDEEKEDEGGNEAEEMEWETEDGNDNDAGSGSSSVAPGPSNAATAGPVTARWNYVAGDEYPWRCLTCPNHKAAHSVGIKNKSSMVRHFNLTHGLEGVQLPH